MAPTFVPARRPSSGWEDLRSGERVFVRPIQPSDASALVDFHEHLSETTRRLRFFSLHPHLTHDEVARFTNVDHAGREALVGFHLGRVIAVGRFDAMGPESGEVAFVVADEWQSKGLGSRLLRRLGCWAHDRGFARFEAEVLGGNGPMLHVFARYAPDRKTTFADGVVHLDMPLPGQPV
jgi:GNAT superfamily N-acetyltransferase